MRLQITKLNNLYTYLLSITEFDGSLDDGIIIHAEYLEQHFI